MASKIFKQIFERQIAQFVGLYSEDSTAIFKDERDRLIHQGNMADIGKKVVKNCFDYFLGKRLVFPKAL